MLLSGCSNRVHRQNKCCQKRFSTIQFVTSGGRFTATPQQSGAQMYQIDKFTSRDRGICHCWANSRTAFQGHESEHVTTALTLTTNKDIEGSGNYAELSISRFLAKKHAVGGRLTRRRGGQCSVKLSAHCIL